jgi:DNA repair ATPase RecN
MALKIKRLSTSGGFLKNSPIEFSDGLTCIIGARGTCKSTIVETIRFTFDCNAEKVSEMVAAEPEPGVDTPSHQGLLAATLAGGTAKCDLRDDTDDIKLTLEREIGAETRVYRDGVKQLDNRDVLRCVEIYSQGELQKIAEDGSRRIDLIDQPNQKRINQLQKQRTDHANKLREVGNQIRTRRAGVESRRAELKALDQFQEELNSLQKNRPQLSPELDAERQSYEVRRTVLAKTSEVVEEWRSVASTITSLKRVIDQQRGTASSLRRLGLSEAETLAIRFEEAASFLEKAEQQASIDAGELEKQSKQLASTIDKLNERYFELRKGQQALNDALKKEDQIRLQISHLERIRDEVSKWVAELQELADRRTRLRKDIELINDEIFELRASEVDKINALYHEKVLLTLNHSCRSDGYRSTLERLLDKSRLRSQEELAEELAKKILPHQLVDIVEAGDSQRLATVLDRDLGQMARLVGYLLDNSALYELETQIFEDQLEITLYDDGVPKRVDQLSKGQKATAILPLILRDAEYPLIFDQPEDDLDNRFIFETLVERIRELKIVRQLIFVTHNANIPVLGDAETVAVMSMETPTQAAVPVSGKVDEVKERILSLLEGGAEAFNMRRERYGNLLT